MEYDLMSRTDLAEALRAKVIQVDRMEQELIGANSRIAELEAGGKSAFEERAMAAEADRDAMRRTVGEEKKALQTQVESLMESNKQLQLERDAALAELDALKNPPA